MASEMIEKALARATDTRACEIGDGVLEKVPSLFRTWFPSATQAVVVCDPRTRAAAGERVEALLAAAGVAVSEHVLEPGGKTFHGDYRYAEEVREAIRSVGGAAAGESLVPVAVGSGVLVPTMMGCRS